MWGESAMAEARVVRPDRRQLGWDIVDLEGLLPADHRARIVWSFVESLDLSQLYERVKSREGEAGRPAADPALMLALWLYATVERVGSARAFLGGGQQEARRYSQDLRERDRPDISRHRASRSPGSPRV
jgi:hypothetical protein